MISLDGSDDGRRGLRMSVFYTTFSVCFAQGSIAGLFRKAPEGRDSAWPFASIALSSIASLYNIFFTIFGSLIWPELTLAGYLRIMAIGQLFPCFFDFVTAIGFARLHQSTKEGRKHQPELDISTCLLLVSFMFAMSLQYLPVTGSILGWWGEGGWLDWTLRLCVFEFVGNVRPTVFYLLYHRTTQGQAPPQVQDVGEAVKANVGSEKLELY